MVCVVAENRMTNFPLMISLSLVMLLAIGANAFCQPEITARLKYNNNEFYGLPLGFDGKNMALLDPGSKLILVPAKSANDFEVVADEFRSYTHEQMAELLEREFGKRYDVSKTDRFVVVHPWGSPAVYAKPFETFYQRFIKFFETHGIKLTKPRSPMVAVVLRSRNDFDRSLINEIDIRDSRISGFYSRFSNRITTYDPSAQLRKSGDRWLYKASPVIHEATHQSAFNTGLHNRFSPPPKWLSEGIATLFEAPGFNHASQNKGQARRVNISRLRQLRKHLTQGGINAALINLIANDKIFQSDIELAYALSWGLSFYLYESQPKKYFGFIKQDSTRKNFQPYTQDERLRDFVNAFGNDFEALERQLRSFYLKKETPNDRGDDRLPE